MWRYNDLGIKGKLYCQGVQKDIGRTENEINMVSENLSIVLSELNTCVAEDYEKKIHNLMSDYEFYKLEVYVTREKLTNFRMRYHSRSRIKYYLSAYSEIVSNLPDLGLEKDKCETEWKLSASYVTSFINQLTEFKTDSDNKLNQYKTSYDELTKSIAEA